MSAELQALVDGYGWPPYGLKQAMPHIIAVDAVLRSLYRRNL